MAELVREVMTLLPVSVPLDMNLLEAARTMKEFDIGSLIVTVDGAVAA